MRKITTMALVAAVSLLSSLAFAQSTGGIGGSSGSATITNGYGSIGSPIGGYGT